MDDSITEILYMVYHPEEDDYLSIIYKEMSDIEVSLPVWKGLHDQISDADEYFVRWDSHHFTFDKVKKLIEGEYGKHISDPLQDCVLIPIEDGGMAHENYIRVKELFRGCKNILM
jgi:hypothetical protein